jgi:uroporphyrinogen decarboxylase
MEPAPDSTPAAKNAVGGGMDKRVFAADRAAVDAEINRMKPLVELGGYIPCPDHRIPLEAEWDLVRYYCDRMKKTFG